MKKILVFLACSFIYLVTCAAVEAQTTNVTATVVDSDSTVWANGTWTLAFQVGVHQSNPAAYTIGGSPLDKAVAYQSGTADGSGIITFTNYQSTAIQPAGSSWNLTVCPNASSACATINFSTGASTLNLSSQINAAIVAPRFNAVSGAYGYIDTETKLTIPAGGTYWNVTSGTQRCYNNVISTWGVCSSGSSAYPSILTGSNNNIVGAGDSRIAIGTLSQIDFLTQLATMTQLSGHGTIYNTGVLGQTCSTMTTNYVADVQPFKPGGGIAKSLLFVESGINDVFNGSSASTVTTCLENYVTQATSDGFQVTLLSLFWGVNEQAGQESIRTQINDNLRTWSGLSYPNLFVDQEHIVPVQNLSANANSVPNIWQEDGNHLTSGGNFAVATYINAILPLQTSMSTASIPPPSTLTLNQLTTVDFAFTNAEGILQEIPCSGSTTVTLPAGLSNGGPYWIYNNPNCVNTVTITAGVGATWLGPSTLEPGNAISFFIQTNIYYPLGSYGMLSNLSLNNRELATSGNLLTNDGVVWAYAPGGNVTYNLPNSTLGLTIGPIFISNLNASAGSVLFTAASGATNFGVQTVLPGEGECIVGVPSGGNTAWLPCSSNAPVNNPITFATGGSGTGTITCLTASCTNVSGTYSVVGGTFTTGNLLVLVWPTTTAAYNCTISQNGGTATYGIGHSVATATGMTITAGISVIGVTVTIDYACSQY